MNYCIVLLKPSMSLACPESVVDSGFALQVSPETYVSNELFSIRWPVQ